MRTLTHPHTGDLPAELAITVPSGVIEIHAEPRHDTTVTLEPLDPADPVAADLIERATANTSPSGVYTVRVPEPAGNHGTVINGGIINGDHNITVVTGTVTGTVTGLVINGNGAIMAGPSINGVTVTGRGAVRATVKVPANADVDVDTTSADTRVSGPLGAVVYESISGDLRSTGTIRYLDAVTVSGDVMAPVVDQPSVATTSGDVRLTLTGGSGQARTVSGDITIYATTDATVTAQSVSGDITVTHAPGLRVRTAARSVSGRVRTGE